MAFATAMDAWYTGREVFSTVTPCCSPRARASSSRAIPSARTMQAVSASTDTAMELRLPITVTQAQSAGARPITLENVICRVGEGAGLAMHIDVDEANACMLPRNASARMRPKAETAASSPPPDAAPPVPAGEALFEGKLITEATARQLASKGIGALAVGPGVILTPSARDVLLHAGIAVRQTGGSR